MNEHNQMISLR